tara:strand:- start:134 stop:286 length:153 start_codon:yes stop_codon:yes gene_type:complete
MNDGIKKILIAFIAIFILWFILAPGQLNSSACWALNLIGGGENCATSISW